MRDWMIYAAIVIGAVGLFALLPIGILSTNDDYWEDLPNPNCKWHIVVDRQLVGPDTTTKTVYCKRAP